MTPRAARLPWVALAVSFLASGAAQCGSLSLTPVRAELKPGQRTTNFELKNPTDQAIVVQAEPRKWSQDGGRDNVVADNGLIVAPPVIKLPPQGRQVVRVALRNPQSATVEQSYRVSFREVPPETPDVSTGVRTIVELSVPVFVAPDKPISDPPSLSCHVAGSGALDITRNGPVHYRFTRLRSVGSGDQRVLHEGQVYVLAGASRRVNLPSNTTIRAGDTLAFDAGGRDAQTCTVASR
ncbi:fimbrial biogenesis chaperone [Tahibacter amnicola]|uniref:Fimbria/pilus periplasmic chaperone n=1 Tax=Tahibacter amnicola TaxID=2976241 RepID=A0ABY6BCP3_9GAMM|nr:fimbria/pilus periplasmic chaperone [Tahibacter amnicola]UXI67312.1 fimbria/pilus periplasmic chaperone [Tahibacter amnicola]